MEAGDLVRLKGTSSKLGVALKFIEKKCWRTEELGIKVDWHKIDPEPHAVVLINGDKRAIPVTDLEPIDEG